MSAAEFRRLAELGAFVEHAEYNAENYGTSHDALKFSLKQRGHDVLLEIDVHGAAQMRERRPDARFIFLLPPSMEELERRLRYRGTDSDDAIDRRLAMADRELEAVRFFDYLVINDVLDQSVSEVLEIVAAEREGSSTALDRIRDRFERGPAFERWQQASGSA